MVDLNSMVIQNFLADKRDGELHKTEVYDVPSTNTAIRIRFLILFLLRKISV